MQDEKYRNIAIGCLVIVLLISLFVQRKDGKGYSLASFVGLIVLFGAALVAPFVSMWLAVCVLIITWFKRYQDILNLWQSISNKKIGGGSQ